MMFSRRKELLMVDGILSVYQSLVLDGRSERIEYVMCWSIIFQMIDADHKASPLIGVPLKRSRSRSAEAESAGFIRLAESNSKRNLKEERERLKRRESNPSLKLSKRQEAEKEDQLARSRRSRRSRRRRRKTSWSAPTPKWLASFFVPPRGIQSH